MTAQQHYIKHDGKPKFNASCQYYANRGQVEKKYRQKQDNTYKESPEKDRYAKQRSLRSRQKLCVKPMATRYPLLETADRRQKQDYQHTRASHTPNNEGRRLTGGFGKISNNPTTKCILLGPLAKNLLRKQDRPVFKLFSPRLT